MLIKGSLKDRQTIVYHASVVWFPNDYVQVNGIDTIMPHNKEGKNHKEKTKKKQRKQQISDGQFITNTHFRFSLNYRNA